MANKSACLQLGNDPSGTYGWKPQQWPATVDVNHAGIDDLRVYVPERTSKYTFRMRESFPDVEVCYVELSCGCTVALADLPAVSTVHPKYCPNCGSKVIGR